MSPKTKKKPNVKKVKASSIYGEFGSSSKAASEEARFGTGGSSTTTSSDVPEVHQEQGVDIAFCVCDHSLESHDSLGTCHTEGCSCTAFKIETLQRTVEEIRNSMTDEDWKVMDSARMNHESVSTIDNQPSNADTSQLVQSPIETFLIALCIQVNENPEGFNVDSFIHHLDASGLGRYLQYAKSLIEATQTEETMADSRGSRERAKGSWDNWDDKEVQKELNSPEEHLPVDPAAVGPPIGGYTT